MTGVYVISSCFMLVILSILLVKIVRDAKWEQSKRTCVGFLVVLELYVLMDALFVVCFLNAKEHVMLFRTVVALFYFVYILMPYAWYLFMERYIGKTPYRWFHILERVPLVMMFVLVIGSIPGDYLWSIDANGVYTRGSLFSIFSIINLFYYVISFLKMMYALVTNKDEDRRFLFQASFFSAVPLLGILINTYLIPVYEVYPFQPFCLVIGAVLAYMFMVDRQRNISEMKHHEQLCEALEQEKKALQDARRAGRVKSTFLANMSHDIRTPMNAILGFAGMIERNPEDAENVKNAVGKIKASGDILLKIINDILDLSRLESGKMQVSNSVLNLEEMAENLKLMLTYTLEKKQIDLEIRTEMENPYVWCDETKLQQIMVNELSNAAKFTENGGKIVLEMRQGLVCDGMAEYRISVKDNGIGMDPEFQKHAFEAFERERTSTESGAQGTGLGLAIVKRLVELMEGQVEIHSKLGEGTEILVHLFLKVADESEMSQVHTEKIEENALLGMKVLVVEDNELNAEIATAVLSELGVQVDTAEDGIVCLDKLENNPAKTYDLVLMDIQMPRLDGYQAAKKIRNLPDKEKAEIPIIAMTANAFEEDKQRALAAGMNDFIAKPFVREELTNMMAEYKQENR